MKWTSWAFLAFLGSLAFLVLFIADQQMNARVDRLSTMRTQVHRQRGEIRQLQKAGISTASAEALLERKSIGPC